MVADQFRFPGLVMMYGINSFANVLMDSTYPVTALSSSFPLRLPVMHQSPSLPYHASYPPLFQRLNHSLSTPSATPTLPPPLPITPIRPSSHLHPTHSSTNPPPPTHSHLFDLKITTIHLAFPHRRSEHANIPSLTGDEFRNDPRNPNAKTQKPADKR